MQNRFERSPRFTRDTSWADLECIDELVGMVPCENDGAFCGHVAPPDDVHLLKKLLKKKLHQRSRGPRQVIPNWSVAILLSGEP